MAKVDKAMVLNMLNAGYSKKEIAEKIGCSASYLRVKFAGIGRHRGNKTHYEKIVYSGIARWIESRKMSVWEFAKLIEKETPHVYGILYGRLDIRKSTVDLILSKTGMTYEEAFGRENKEDC